ncbi:MAG: hypothetical protein PWP58_1006 [Bacillota bacterium]|nr:hypothetical protein [Bacillota bacterium]
MIVYVDTSAFLAVLNADDSNHAEAKRAWIRLLHQHATLVCNNYVLVETFALIQRRLGMEAVRAFNDNVVPVLRVEWVNDLLHMQAINALLTADRRGLSLVDCASFVTMRNLGIYEVFAFDKHFAEQGFHYVNNMP